MLFHKQSTSGCDKKICNKKENIRTFRMKCAACLVVRAELTLSIGRGTVLCLALYWVKCTFR